MHGVRGDAFACVALDILKAEFLRAEKRAREQRLVGATIHESHASSYIAIRCAVGDADKLAVSLFVERATIITPALLDELRLHL